MGQLRIALRAYAAEGHPPATVMARASVFLCELDTDRFATCLYVQLDPSTGTMVVVNAGHLSPLVRQPDGTCREILTHGGLPLGLSSQFGALEYPLTPTELEPGATLLMFSDGLVERPGADLDDGVRILAAALHDGPQDTEELADGLCAAMGGLLGGHVHRLRIEVQDLDSGWPRRREPGEGEVSGRGLLMVSRIADSWGVESHGAGKSVWSEFRAA